MNYQLMSGMQHSLQAPLIPTQDPYTWHLCLYRYPCQTGHGNI